MGPLKGCNFIGYTIPSLLDLPTTHRLYRPLFIYCLIAVFRIVLYKTSFLLDLPTFRSIRSQSQQLAPFLFCPTSLFNLLVCLFFLPSSLSFLL